MVCRTMVLSNKTGLHMRPAGLLVGEANRCRSHIMMIHGEHKMNCKSLMSLLAFPVPPGDEVTIECEGEDEEQDLERITDFIAHLE